MVAPFTAAHVAAAKALIDAKADLNLLDSQAYDVITIAAVADDVAMLELALASGGNARAITSPYKGTALIAAAHLGHAKVVEALIAAKAPLDHVNNLAWTALIEAIVLGDGGPRHQATVEALVKGGANLDLADGQGVRPLSLARSRGYKQHRRDAGARRRQALTPIADHARVRTNLRLVPVSPDRRNPMADKRLVYFADPMCSWCYGFSPVIGAIAERFEDRMPLELVMGGLRAGNTSPCARRTRTISATPGPRSNGATGQPFDFAFLERDGFVYDTEPACRAVVTVRRLMPKLALAFMGRVQQAFYAENRDMTSPDEIAAVAEEAGLEREAICRRLPRARHPQRDLPRFPHRPAARHPRLPDADRRQRGRGLRARHQRLPAAR